MADYMEDLKRTEKDTPGPAEEFLVPTNAKLEREMRTAAGWLFALAGLTVVNLVLLQINVPLRMVVSLITAEFVVAVARELGSIAPLFGLMFAGIAVLTTATVGWFALRRAVWAFYVGAVIVIVDAVITYFVTTLGGLWPFILHGVALWFLYLGAKAARLHRERRAAGKA